MEQWRDVTGYEGYYEVSNLGNVRRKGKQVCLKKTINKDGYVQHCLCVNNKPKHVLAHQLVARAWLGAPPTAIHIPLHNDGVRNNNELSNIRWGTPKENYADSIEHGTSSRGARQGLSKLTEEDVLNIRASTLSMNELAAQYGVVHGTIYHIIKRLTWKHI